MHCETCKSSSVMLCVVWASGYDLLVVATEQIALQVIVCVAGTESATRHSVLRATPFGMKFGPFKRQRAKGVARAHFDYRADEEQQSRVAKMPRRKERRGWRWSRRSRRSLARCAGREQGRWVVWVVWVTRA